MAADLVTSAWRGPAGFRDRARPTPSRSGRLPTRGVNVFFLAKGTVTMIVATHPATRVSDSGREARMKRRLGALVPALGLVAAVVAARPASANTLTQNLSWTIDRPGTTTKYRVTAYGDSIYAGYYGSITNVIKRAAPSVDGEYLSELWNADIEVVRRCKSGAVASDIYNNKIVAERSYMQTTNTRVVTFEMCGNDGLQARSNFAGQSGTCNYAPLNTAQSNCTTYLQNAMQYINANAYSGTKLKVVANLYYPGYAADNAAAGCTDSGTGQHPNKQTVFLPYLARMNWRAC